MTDVQRADSATRRKAVIILIIAAIVGSLIIAIFESYRPQLYDWLLSDQGKSAQRLRLLIILTAALGAIPLLAFSVYLWSFGCKVTNYQRFPLAGQKVIRDALILEGQAATTRGRVLKILAVCLGVAVFMLCLVFWWLISILEGLVI